jgi:hypothetical protein
MGYMTAHVRINVGCYDNPHTWEEGALLTT